MKSRSFKDYLKKRLNVSEISEIKKQVDIEFEALQMLQQNIASVVKQYMKRKNWIQ